MIDHVIHPIGLWRNKRDASFILYQSKIGRQVWLVNYVWYIEGMREKILVDAGGNSEFIRKVSGSYIEDIQTLDEGLHKFGLSPGDIDLIILTHLHSDHVALASNYHQARFLVQKDELEFARNPHPIFALPYQRKFIDGLNYEIVDGDAQVAEGVSVIKTPGHSPGGQSVAINTAQGLVIISGICSFRENFMPPPPSQEPVIIPTLHTNAFAAYESLLKIKKVAKTILPIHDAGCTEVVTIP